MKIFFSVLPIALLVAYSQIMVKWRTLQAIPSSHEDLSDFSKLTQYLSDPFLISAYVSALLASFMWLFVVAKLPLVIAFPVYIGVTFVFVIFGGWFFLSETLSGMRLLAAALILTGIAIGVKT